MKFNVNEARLAVRKNKRANKFFNRKENKMDFLTFLKNKVLEGYKNTQENKKNQSDIESELKKLEDYADQQYSADDLPTPPKYERYEYDAPTDENIKQSAESELSGYLNDGENSIMEEYNRKEKELQADKAQNDRLFAENKEQLKSAYDAAAEALDNDALKRGLARSSIALNNQAKANKTYAENLGELTRQNYARIAELDEQISGLDDELQSALNSFKISYAAKLTERINQLKEEREKNRLEALKYNNSLTKDEYQQNLNAAKEQAAKKPLTEERKEEIENNIYKKAVEFLDSLSKSQAEQLLYDVPFFKENLTSDHYAGLIYRYR